MPFGLCNAGATFQRLMDLLMAGLTFDVCLVYLDDIIVFSATLDEHLTRLEAILQRIVRSGLKLRPDKCNLLQTAVHFLGHVISANGIATDPAKVRLVAEWPTPTSLKQLRGFLGLSGYYRKFVRGYAQVAAPLTAMLRKNQPFLWSDECQAAFDTLKRALISPPVLTMPDDHGTFILDTDASDFSIGRCCLRHRRA